MVDTTVCRLLIKDSLRIECRTFVAHGQWPNCLENWSVSRPRFRLNSVPTQGFSRQMHCLALLLVTAGVNDRCWLRQWRVMAPFLYSSSCHSWNQLWSTLTSAVYKFTKKHKTQWYRQNNRINNQHFASTKSPFFSQPNGSNQLSQMSVTPNLGCGFTGWSFDSHRPLTIRFWAYRTLRGRISKQI